MPSADSDLVSAMFRCLHEAQQGRAGFAQVDASTPDGVAGITFAAVPVSAWPVVQRALELAFPKLPVHRIRGQA